MKNSLSSMLFVFMPRSLHVSFQLSRRNCTALSSSVIGGDDDDDDDDRSFFARIRLVSTPNFPMAVALPQLCHDPVGSMEYRHGDPSVGSMSSHPTSMHWIPKGRLPFDRHSFRRIDASACVMAWVVIEVWYTKW